MKGWNGGEKDREGFIIILLKQNNNEEENLSGLVSSTNPARKRNKIIISAPGGKEVFLASLSFE